MQFGRFCKHAYKIKDQILNSQTLQLDPDPELYHSGPATLLSITGDLIMNWWEVARGQWSGSVLVIIRIRIQVTKILQFESEENKIDSYFLCHAMLWNKKICVKELFFESFFKTWWKKSTFINLLTQNFAIALFCTFICPGFGSVSLHTDPTDPDPHHWPLETKVCLFYIII